VTSGAKLNFSNAKLFQHSFLKAVQQKMLHQKHWMVCYFYVLVVIQD